MTRPSVILHIGLRKTGSSALQEILAKESAALMSKGVHYPDRLSPFPAHQELAWALMQPRPPYAPADLTPDVVYEHYRGIAAENAKQGISTLLSSEDLSLLSFEHNALRHIASAFHPLPVRVAFYVRDALEYHVSNYKHAIFAGRECRSFSEYVFNIDQLVFATSRLIKRIWSGAFGADAVDAFRYERAFSHGESIYGDFCRRALGIEVDDPYASYTSNRGIPDSAVEYVLALNRSDLSDEAIAEAKRGLRSISLQSDVADFLDAQLSTEEKSLLIRLCHG